MTVATPDPGGLQILPGLAPSTFPWRKVGGFLLRNAADRKVVMRIQFVNVPGAGIFGEPSGKVLMCVSEVKGKIDTKDFDDYMQKRLGVAGVLITDEVVRFDPAQPESDLDWAEAVHPCERCLVRPGGTRVASQDCDHA